MTSIIITSTVTNDTIIIMLIAAITTTNVTITCRTSRRPASWSPGSWMQ